MGKLIIWDFDGVVADTEEFWLNIELDALNKYCGLNWDFKTINHYLAGQAFSHQLMVLSELGIYPSEEVIEEITENFYKKTIEGFEYTKGIDEVLALKKYQHVLGTGGTTDETLLKLKAVGLEKEFPPDKIFTIDMVQRGKPHPDTFLLAAEKMGYAPKDCLVVEDSIAGLIAAQRADMVPICYAGAKMYKDNAEHWAKVKGLGVEHIFRTMAELKEFLQKL